MKRLNENGFGMGNLIAFICIFLVILIGVAVLAYNYGKDQNKNTINNNNMMINNP